METFIIDLDNNKYIILWNKHCFVVLKQHQKETKIVIEFK